MDMIKNDLILYVLVEFINLRYIYDFSRSTIFVDTFVKKKKKKKKNDGKAITYII